MMTSKERAALRAQANPLEVTLIVGKSGISQTLLDEAVILAASSRPPDSPPAKRPTCSAKRSALRASPASARNS